MSLDHIGELPEVRRYLDDGKHNFMLHGGFGIRYIRESIADAALAAADREVGRLNVCGNCASWYGDKGSCIGDAPDHCHFTPSRWMRREAP